MALSGRKLNPRIYGSIFQALEASGFADLIAAANSDGGSFDVPDIPGASGYATVYMSPGLGVPVILLAGFDLNETHLVEEVPDYGDPAITASEVVDRETLKGFVTEAGQYLLELGRSGGRNAIWQAKDAMRNPNGPWRQGSVYLYVLDITSNLIMFHGAFPNQYEFLPLATTVRDAVTGELIIPQLIEAAKSNPEGSFVEYYFDDPNDDTDSADIPKVGYALQFTGSFREPDGSFSQNEFIVGSGFYDAPSGLLVNISTRALVGTVDGVMIGGFIIGEGAQQVLIQALGPELAVRDIAADALLADPVLTLTTVDGTVLMTNDNWEDSQGQLVSDLWGESDGAPDAGSASSAIVITLEPGNYTAKVEGKDGTTGIALVEVFQID